MKRLGSFLAALALALLLALALASCSGDAATPDATPPPAPTAIATPEAASTRAPTAAATPEATPTPEAASTPEQACANAVADAEAHPGLAADCEALLRAKDALRGDAPLDWGGGLAVEDWEGVAVSGEPPRVTGLDLRGKGLTGSIPRELRRLRLGEVRLGGNALTGCVPSAFEDASGDAADLGLPWCLRYDRLDAAGEAGEAGEWAILGGNGEALTTWEQLRSEAATLRVHQTDAGGTSWASEFGAVAVNDLFEWRLAGDCWVRYRVTGDPVAPPGASGRWEFPVEWMTYAATGSGCTGAVGAGTVLSVDEEPARLVSRAYLYTPPTRVVNSLLPPVPLKSVYTGPMQAVTDPVRHGPYLVYPIGWSGEVASTTEVTLPSISGDAGMALYATDVATARQHPLWRDPDLPSTWKLEYAKSPRYGYDGYSALYVTAAGYEAAYVGAARRNWQPIIVRTYANAGYVKEMHLIDGLPMLLTYSLEGNRYTYAAIWDAATGIEYTVLGSHHSLANDIEATIMIAKSLLP